MIDKKFAIKFDATRLKNFINEVVVTASPEFQKKEQIRQMVHDMVKTAIDFGVVNNDDELKDFFDVVIMAAQSLRLVPMSMLEK